jgi:hypothetical protein
LIEQVISLIREIEKFPTVGELRMKAHNSKGFPAQDTIYSRLGKQSELPNRILEYCEDKPEYSDIVNICKDVTSKSGASNEQFPKDSDIEFAYVYLMKSGRFYTAIAGTLKDAIMNLVSNFQRT